MVGLDELRGKLVTMKEYRVYCFECGREHQVGGNSRQSAERSLRAEGWRERNYGWFCPEDTGEAMPGEYWCGRESK